MTVVVNGREDFTLENFCRVAYGGEPVQIGPEALRTMEESRAGFMRLLDSDRTQFIYGTTSGAGIRAKEAIPPGEQRANARRLRRLGGRGFGGSLDEAVVRGIVFARLVNFVSGHAKVRPVIAERTAAILEGPIPPVPLDGQVGAGEVLPLAHLLVGFPTDDLEEAEGMSLSNGSPCSAALAADVAVRAGHRLAQAESVLALSVEAFRAPLDAYDEVFDGLWGDEDETAALQALRRLLEGAERSGRLFHQAPVSYRILPRVLGRARRAVRACEKAARVSLRSVTDNPVYVPPDGDHPLGRAFSTGGYHNSMAPAAINGVAAAWAELSLIAERHVTALNSATTSGLPLNLSPPGAEGAGTYAYGWAAGGYVEEARAAAMPTLLPAQVNDPQDDVSLPTFSAYGRALRASDCLDGALAILALVSSQALFATDRLPAPPLRPLLEVVREIFPPIDGRGPRDLSAEGARLQRALREAALSGELAVP